MLKSHQNLPCGASMISSPSNLKMNIYVYETFTVVFLILGFSKTTFSYNIFPQSLTPAFISPADPLQQHAARGCLPLAQTGHPCSLPRLARHQRCILQENSWLVNTILHVSVSTLRYPIPHPNLVHLKQYGAISVFEVLS